MSTDDNGLMNNAGASLTIPTAAEVDTASRKNDHNQSVRRTHNGQFGPTAQIDTELERHREQLDLALAEETELKARANGSATSTPDTLRRRIDHLSNEIAYGLTQRQKIVASHVEATGNVESRQLVDLRKANMDNAVREIQRENREHNLTAVEAMQLLEREFEVDGDAAVAKRLPQYYRMWKRLSAA